MSKRIEVLQELITKELHKQQGDLNRLRALQALLNRELLDGKMESNRATAMPPLWRRTQWASGQGWP